VGLRTCTDAAKKIPNWTPVPARKLVPEIVTVVLPSVEPLLGEMLEIVGPAEEATLRESPVADEVDFASSTCAVKEKFPGTAGVPLIVPLAAFT
jgi:hypothetical protein